MQQIFPLEPPSFRLAARLKSVFKILIAGENEKALLHAGPVHEQVVALCGEEVEISRVFWNFGLLRHEELRRHAALEAARADMIVISASGGMLPAHVKSWVQTWPVRDQMGHAALVALLEPGEDSGEEQASLVRYLQQTAEFCGLEFFCNGEGTERDLFSSRLAERAEGWGGEDMVFPGHVPWHSGGLNE